MPREKTAPESKFHALAVGLVALDVIDDRIANSVSYSVGGTAANVASILAVLGWQSSVAARLTADWARDVVFDDLERFGCSTRFASMEPRTATPIIVERLAKDSAGVPHHSFSFSCPKCGGRLPSYQSITLPAAEAILEELVDSPRVVLIDRVSPASLLIARSLKERGSLVYFEPTAIGDERNFSGLVAIADVIKYSVDRLDEIDRGKFPTEAKLEIQTLGRGGLKYRSRAITGKGVWRHIDAAPATDLRDTTGAGDWMSAHLIHYLLGKKAPLDVSHSRLEQVLHASQQFSSWSCGFAGALGALRENTQTVVRDQAGLSGKLFRISNQIDGKAVADARPFASVCCGDAAARVRKKSA